MGRKVLSELDTLVARRQFDHEHRQSVPAGGGALIRDNLLAAGADPSFFYLARANSDLQSGLARSESNLYRMVAGLEGEFEIGGRPFQWEIARNYGNSETTSREPMIVQQNFENALDAVVDPATGRIVCRGMVAGTLESAPIRTRSSSCAPLNLFGFDSPSQAARDYITTQAMHRRKSVCPAIPICSTRKQIHARGVSFCVRVGCRR